MNMKMIGWAALAAGLMVVGCSKGFDPKSEIALVSREDGWVTSISEGVPPPKYMVYISFVGR